MLKKYIGKRQFTFPTERMIIVEHFDDLHKTFEGKAGDVIKGFPEIRSELDMIFDNNAVPADEYDDLYDYGGYDEDFYNDDDEYFDL